MLLCKPVFDWEIQVVEMPLIIRDKHSRQTTCLSGNEEVGILWSTLLPVLDRRR
jgi:hypothetical protein